MTTDGSMGPMQSFLLTAVPLGMMALAAKGGPGDDDRAAMAGYSQMLAEHGDDLLFGGKYGGGAAADLARAVALLSYLPGGIRLFGLHFSAVEDPPVYGRATE
jgi:hypothetical protein